MKTMHVITVCVFASLLGGCVSTNRSLYKNHRTSDSAILVGNRSATTYAAIWLTAVDGAPISRYTNDDPKTPIYAEPGEHQVKLYVEAAGQHGAYLLPMILKPQQTYHFDAAVEGLGFVVTAWEGERGSTNKIELNITGEPIYYDWDKNRTK